MMWVRGVIENWTAFNKHFCRLSTTQGPLQHKSAFTQIHKQTAGGFSTKCQPAHQELTHKHSHTDGTAHASQRQEQQQQQQ